MKTFKILFVYDMMMVDLLKINSKMLMKWHRDVLETVNVFMYSYIEVAALYSKLHFYDWIPRFRLLFPHHRHHRALIKTYWRPMNSLNFTQVNREWRNPNRTAINQTKQTKVPQADLLPDFGGVFQEVLLSV